MVGSEAELASRLAVGLTREFVGELRPIANSQQSHFARSEINGFETQPATFVGINGPLPLFQTVAVAGFSRDVLIVCTGELLKTFSLPTGANLCAELLPLNVIRIAVCPADPNIFAVASLMEVQVLCLKDGGGIEILHKVELMLEARTNGGSLLFVMAIDWVPQEALHLAISTSQWVIVYDVPSDCISPISYFHVKPPDKISSTVLLEWDEKPYLLLGLNNGRIGIQPLQIEANGPVLIQKFIDLTPIFNVGVCHISMCKEDGLLFISCPKNAMRVAKVEAIFSELRGENFGVIKVNSSDPLVFSCVHPVVSSFYFFQTIFNGRVEMIEITSLGVAAAIPDHPSSPSVLQDHSLFVMGIAQFNQSVIYVGTDGGIYELRAGNSSGNLQIKFEAENRPSSREESDGFAFTVPASFWMASTSESNGICITDRVGSDFTSLLHHRFVFDRSHVELIIRCTDINRTIVGLRLNWEGRNQRNCPCMIKLFNRRYDLRGFPPRRLCIPLKESEAEAGSVVILDIESNGGDLGLDDIAVFTIESSDTRPKKMDRSDWRFDGRSISDFTDVDDGRYRDDLEFILASLSAADFVVDRPSDRESIKRLLVLMYERPNLAKMCRRIVLKSWGRNEGLARVWSEAIEEICNRGSVSERMVQLLWRDYSLLPLAEQGRLSDLIWRCFAIGTGTHTIVVAMTEREELCL
jgi:hypothetical protein